MPPVTPAFADALRARIAETVASGGGGGGGGGGLALRMGLASALGAAAVIAVAVLATRSGPSPSPTAATASVAVPSSGDEKMRKEVVLTPGGDTGKMRKEVVLTPGGETPRGRAGAGGEAIPTPSASTCRVPADVTAHDRPGAPRRRRRRRAPPARARATPAHPRRRDRRPGAANDHARRFARGALAEEREVLRIRALAASGRAADARSAADAFRARWPKSIHRDVVDRAAP
ncbi:MAG: hypothetical protein U1F43_25380 [Myxococcota bacterium]